MKPNVRIDRRFVRAEAPSTRYALVSLTAPEAPRRAERQPVNVAFVLDRSGSMGGQKIRLACEAVNQALRLLRPEDRFALVVYDDQVDVVVESTNATREAVRNALQRLAQVDARGSTDLGGGWLRGCEQIAAHLGPDSVGRCLLLTDGLANCGITDHDELCRHASELRTRRITTSTFGVGTDFDERLLHPMADAGAGHFYFIETAPQIPDLLTSELGEALETVARDAALVALTPGVQAEPLNPFPFRAAADGSARVALGDLVSGQDVAVVLKLTFPLGAKGDTVAARFRLEDREHVLGDEWQVAGWTFAGHHENDIQERDRLVDRAVADLYAARARAEALEHNRAGRYGEARRVLEATERRIRQHGGSDAELNHIADLLRQDQSLYDEHMTALAMKKQHFASYNVTHRRDAVGKARKGPNA
ncbi:MAG: VWA domain-containing protein [Acidobacteria bacterium]|nr:MAG: VWA domain-containing protein [Acidobacteriota bacterium]